MGGYGSTRWTWEHTRRDTGGLLRLDVRHMHRAGVLRPGTAHAWQWTNGRGEPAGTITMRMNGAGDCLTLVYRTRAYGETEWTPRTQPVWLETTPCTYGGERVWFTCPGCGTRRAVLYSAGGVFRCRKCHDLAYSSTRQDAIDRGTARIRNLQRKLGAPAGCDSGHVPGKPPRMHWKTYRRLVLQLQEAQDRHDAAFVGRLEALLARSERVIAERS